MINRPIADVFAYLADGLNDPAWHDGILEIERASDVVGVGAMYRQTVRGLGGTRVPADYFVSEYEPPHLLAIEVTAGPVRPAGRFELFRGRPGDDHPAVHSRAAEHACDEVDVGHDHERVREKRYVRSSV